MQRSQQEEKVGVDDDELHQKFKNLQQDWKSFNQSNTRRRRRCSTDLNSMVSIFELLDSSPRNLISSLQQQQQQQESPLLKEVKEEEWNVRNNDLAVVEILSDRRDAIRSGKLKGRRLFEALESANKMGLRGEEEICSGCSSSVLIQGSEVRSLCSSSDDDECLGSGGGGGRCCSSSRTSPVSMEREKEVVMGGEVEEKRVVGDGGKWMVFMGFLAILLMVIALCIILFCSFHGHVDGEETMFPT